MYLGRHVLLSLADLDDIHRRQQALKSLLNRRHRLLHESLEQRIIRARKEGQDGHLTRDEWLSRHEQELVKVRGQIADLELEILYARDQGTQLRKTMARAKRLKDTQPSKSRRQA